MLAALSGFTFGAVTGFLMARRAAPLWESLIIISLGMIYAAAWAGTP